MKKLDNISRRSIAAFSEPIKSMNGNQVMAEPYRASAQDNGFR